MPPVSSFLALTSAFNEGRLRAVICSGQAVVLHRLAMMSKDGDWIVRENEADLAHIRQALAARGARYRYGAPLDARWLAGGWSSHLEFQAEESLRIRTDFFSRPPRLSTAEVTTIWREQEAVTVPFVGVRELALMKMTQREKDYPIIGELARKLVSVEDQLRLSRSTADLLRLAVACPKETAAEVAHRPLLLHAIEGNSAALAQALDAERRGLMLADAERLRRYHEVGEAWAKAWPKLEQRVADLPLEEAHGILCAEAEGQLPFAP